MTRKIVTANRLEDGLVVYLTAAGGWSESIAESCVALSEQDGAELLSLVDGNGAGAAVVDPYLVEVSEEEGAIRPLDLRETIRARGPTVRLDVGKQAEGR